MSVRPATKASIWSPVISRRSLIKERFPGSLIATAMRPLTRRRGSTRLRRAKSSGIKRAASASTSPCFKSATWVPNCSLMARVSASSSMAPWLTSSAPTGAGFSRWTSRARANCSSVIKPLIRRSCPSLCSDSVVTSRGTTSTPSGVMGRCWRCLPFRGIGICLPIRSFVPTPAGRQDQVPLQSDVRPIREAISIASMRPWRSSFR